MSPVHIKTAFSQNMKMPSLKFFFFFWFISLLSFLCSFTNAADPTYLDHFCSNSATFTTDSTAYQLNLNILLSSLPSKANGTNGFYNATIGDEPNRVYGIFLCRGDVNSRICRDCVTSATRDVTQHCHVEKEAMIWYDECFLRYSNQYFFSTLAENPQIQSFRPQNFSTDIKWFYDLVWQLTTDAANEAANSTKKFATREVNYNVETLYSLAQCTQDLSSSDCSRCFQKAIADLHGCCSQKQGGMIFSPSCIIRYDLDYFYYWDGIPAPTPLSPPSPASVTRSKESKATWIVIGTTAPSVIVVLLFGSFLCHTRRRNKGENTKRQAVQLLQSGAGGAEDDYILQGQKQVDSQDFPLFPLGLILEATNNFSVENKLGEGGFGPVYKGMVADGKEIAVKRLSKTSGQGLQEFKNEVILIAKLQHKNLVRLLGCCLEGNEFLLIYEYMPNKSLDVHLFDSTRGVQIDWKRRVNIINGIARGLLYLHEDSRLKIIHRDLKTSNILLDNEMNPKISDFGMVKIFSGNQNQVTTNRIVGTYGYMAPEYAMEGAFSVKSDIFSFGVLLLEIMSGRKNTGSYISEYGQSLLTYAWKLWCEGRVIELMDPILLQSCVTEELLKFIHIGLLCVQENPINRVVFMLVSDRITLPKPTQPAFSISRVVAKPTQSSLDNKDCSINEVTLSDVAPR